MLVQHCGLAPGDLGVISPYAAQVSLLSKQLQERGYTINARGGSSDQEDEGWVPDELEVKSVDGYQGREKEVILLSTVRANSQQQVGFVDDWRRANVALSRARTALVVIGHRSTLRGSETWSAFLKHVAEQGCLVKQEQLQLQLRTSKKKR
ncbi:AAA domain-containing protein [Scenedesmus sp. NREL 46B-D3]|nr:AAA domain-containing protein [Scenedesmus sp. NREL 46B-D3]